MRVTLAQIDCVLGDVSANARRALEVLRQAQGEGADLVVFPELSLTGYSIGEVSDDLALEVTDPPLATLAAEAGGTDLLVGFQEVGGGLHSYNAAAYFEAGELRHLHRKLYLPTYGIFEERKHFSPGQSMRAFATRWGRQAMLICNDAWQPQLAFIAVQDGARILLLPTNSAQSLFPEHFDSITYWRDVTRFYARMFQSFVVFVNRVGQEGKLQFWGGSHVVDPWGRVVAEAPEGREELLIVEVDLDEVRRRRREVPLVREARLGVLQKELRRLAEEGGDL
ncbi:MAG TPA: nitrilase-related carbon-nitrogen hydrolase [Actinomycetes bacterium]|jgi:predicted amidohydrolase|nr:nitrilase-related carbon-nitrogen hydrolase [Actinomycetes bacterium]